MLGSPAAGMPAVSLSMKAVTWLSGTAPMKPSAGWPLTKAITAGIDWMPIWPRDRRMLVDVHLDQLDLALGGADRLFEDRRELPAGAAPRRPEVDQHRLALRFLDDVLHEGLGGGFLDQIGRRLRRRSAALLNDGHGILA